MEGWQPLRLTGWFYRFRISECGFIVELDTNPKSEIEDLKSKRAPLLRKEGCWADRAAAFPVFAPTLLML